MRAALFLLISSNLSILAPILKIIHMAEGGKDVKSPQTSSNESDESLSQTKDDKSGNDSVMDKIEKLLHKLGITKPETDSEEEKEEAEAKLTIEEIAEQIKTGKRKNIIVMCGAGISTSAGIPDFRSPGSGLYNNLEKYDLPDPQCIFEISYFKTNPRPFYALAKELLPGLLKPTPCHYFIRLLSEKGHLMRVYTQNIDTLERIAGIPDEKIVEAHGTFHTSHCMQPTCKKEFTLEWMKAKITSDELPKCPDCGTIIKPDVVFFGENLPVRFFKLSDQDFQNCDLLMVMGTSLVVQPFASLVGRVSRTTPRLLINKEKAGEVDPILSSLGFRFGMDFTSARDVAWLGTCDDGCLLLAKLLGWQEELETLIEQEHVKLVDQYQEAKKAYL